MKSSFRFAGLVLALLAGAFAPIQTVAAATFSFTTDPFAGSTALTTPGRQVVIGEPSITFNPATDVFVFETTAFGINSLSFANNVIGSIPATGVNTIVLLTFDDDGSGATAFGAGNAANLIAGQLTAPAPGFFIYFNSGLDLPRLVFSADLNDPTADLKILARMTNLTGQTGRDAMAGFSAANFQLTTAVPDGGSSLLLAIAAAALLAGGRRLARRTC